MDLVKDMIALWARVLANRISNDLTFLRGKFSSSSVERKAVLEDVIEFLKLEDFTVPLQQIFKPVFPDSELMFASEVLRVNADPLAEDVLVRGCECRK